MKILWLTENYPPQRGGMSVSCDRIVRNLRKNDIEIDVAHFSPRYLKWKSENKINGLQFACPVRSDISHTLNRFWGLIVNKGYTHAVAFGGLLPMISGPIYSKWMNCDLITMIRGNDFDTGIFSPKRSDILRQALENSDCICAVSRQKVEKISKLYPEKKVCYTPNGIDQTEWEFSDEDIALAKIWRNENKVGGKRVLGMFGQMKRKKGGLFFLNNLLRSGCVEEFHVLFVGDMEPEMDDLIDENADRLSYSHLPFMDRYELLPFYAACDFISIPSFYDGMPNVLLESAALGIPVIASDVDGMKDVLTNDKNAILFRPGDDFDCRLAIQKCAKIGTESNLMLKKAIYAAAKAFDVESETLRFLSVFNVTDDSVNKEAAHA